MRSFQPFAGNTVIESTQASTVPGTQKLFDHQIIICRDDSHHLCPAESLEKLTVWGGDVTLLPHMIAGAGPRRFGGALLCVLKRESQHHELFELIERHVVAMIWTLKTTSEFVDCGTAIQF